jgi:hypothetical protein
LPTLQTKRSQTIYYPYSWGLHFARGAVLNLLVECEVELVWAEKRPTATLSSWLLTGDDLKASSSFAAPQKVAPRVFTKPSSGGPNTKFEVPAHSYAALPWSI